MKMVNAVMRHAAVVKKLCKRCNEAMPTWRGDYCARCEGMAEVTIVPRPPLQRELAAVADTMTRDLESQAAAHARWMWESGLRYARAIRDGDPARAQVELDDVARRLMTCEDIVGKLRAKLRIAEEPELLPCEHCGAKQAYCHCEAF